MTKEDYVSFEVAKLLKEKGFNEICLRTYFDDGKMSRIYDEDEGVYNENLLPSIIACPTQQMAMKWLREEYNIFIHISITQKSMYDSINELVFGEPEYNYKIEHLYSYEENYGRESYDTYEEAVEAAIKYVLENLI